MEKKSVSLFTIPPGICSSKPLSYGEKGSSILKLPIKLDRIIHGEEEKEDKDHTSATRREKRGNFSPNQRSK